MRRKEISNHFCCFLALFPGVAMSRLRLDSTPFIYFIQCTGEELTWGERVWSL